MDSSPYSQHPQLLEPREVILVDPSDVVPVEFPGGGKENGMVRHQGQAPRPGLSSILPSTELHPVFSPVGPGASQPSPGTPKSMSRPNKPRPIFATDAQPAREMHRARACCWESCANQSHSFCPERAQADWRDKTFLQGRIWKPAIGGYSGRSPIYKVGVIIATISLG